MKRSRTENNLFFDEPLNPDRNQDYPHFAVRPLRQLATDAVKKILVSIPAKQFITDPDVDFEFINECELSNVRVTGMVPSNYINQKTRLLVTPKRTFPALGHDISKHIYDNYLDRDTRDNVDDAYRNRVYGPLSIAGTGLGYRLPGYNKPPFYMSEWLKEQDEKHHELVREKMEPTTGEMSASMVSYDPESRILAISINNTLRPEFWQRIMIDLNKLEDWDYTDTSGGRELKFETVARYEDVESVLRSYDPETRILTIRSESLRLYADFWTEINLDLNKVEEWCSKQISENYEDGDFDDEGVLKRGKYNDDEEHYDDEDDEIDILN